MPKQRHNYRLIAMFMAIIALFVVVNGTALASANLGSPPPVQAADVVVQPAHHVDTPACGEFTLVSSKGWRAIVDNDYAHPYGPFANDGNNGPYSDRAPGQHTYLFQSPKSHGGWQNQESGTFTVTACATPTPVVTPTPDDSKIELCHATGSQTNPYTRPSVNKNAITNLPNGHAWHEDDIIPPFPGKAGHNGWLAFAGLNWDATGQAIWNNGCQVPEPSPSITASPSPSPSLTPSPSPSPTASPSPSPSITASPSPSPSLTPSPSPSLTASPSPSPSPSPSASPSPSSSPTPPNTSKIETPIGPIDTGSGFPLWLVIFDIMMCTAGALVLIKLTHPNQAIFGPLTS